MVHLAAIHHADGEPPKATDPASAGVGADPDAAAKLIEKKTHLLQLASYGDEFTTSVYGSRFAAQELPTTKMPECQMPREVAYRMIKDELSLDGNPKLKCVLPQLPAILKY